MRKLDALVIDYPDTFKCISVTDIEKTYEMSKSAVSYRKPRRLSTEQREAARKRVSELNNSIIQLVISRIEHKPGISA